MNAISGKDSSHQQDRDRRRVTRSINDDAIVADIYLDIGIRRLPPIGAAAKRAIDIVGALIGLLLLAPLMFVTALAIKINSRGPVFYAQTRLTIGGRHFRMWKFRSMIVNAEEMQASLGARNEMSGPVFKIKNDPRVTLVGRYIRRTSIDELPQLWNVLLGDMSLVGPRPPLPTEIIKYRIWQRRRLTVKSGITCIWQISGRNQIDFEDWMRLDLQYIDQWSLRKDAIILAKTAAVVVTGIGAS